MVKVQALQRNYKVEYQYLFYFSAGSHWQRRSKRTLKEADKKLIPTGCFLSKKLLVPFIEFFIVGMMMIVLRAFVWDTNLPS